MQKTVKTKKPSYQAVCISFKLLTELNFLINL